MAISSSDKRLLFLDEEEYLNPSGLNMAYRDYWWICTPHEGVLFWMPTGRVTWQHPQCNKDHEVAKRIHAKLYPWAKLSQIEFVGVPVDKGLYSWQ
jgi:hypothetical protein